MTVHAVPVAMKPFSSRSAARAIVDKKIIGRSAVMEQIRTLVATVAPTDASVLALGATGSGKEVIASALHEASGREGSLIPVNCAAIPADLLEAELFGYEKGAFTGAANQRIGRIEMADGGTLFLDEIGDMPPALQAKLLRVLETRKIQRLGSATEIEVDFRLVCATHQNLDAAVAKGTFREDLYYRISVFPIDVPTLTERVEDIPLLLHHMIDNWLLAYPNAGIPHFSEGALEALEEHSWPGNVRELRNLIERAMVLFPDQVIDGNHVRKNLISFNMPGSEVPAVEARHEEQDAVESAISMQISALDAGQNVNLRAAVRDLEVALIEAALSKTNGNVSQTADLLMLRRTTLIEKMRKYGIER